MKKDLIGQKKKEAAELRLRAEAQAGLNPTPKSSSKKTEPDALRLVHELKVHQIELEMQNEELRTARDEVKVGLDRYTELYELAPLGYFTFSQNGLIEQVNLNGARLLGVERSRLASRRFELFIARSDWPTFHDFLKRVFKSHVKETCELALLLDAGRMAEESLFNGRDSNFTSKVGTRWVLIEAVAAENQNSCLAAIVDITERKQAEEKIADLARFPEQNPNPILRIAAEGLLLYANHSSQLLCDALGVRVGQVVSQVWLEHVRSVIDTRRQKMMEVPCGETIYLVTIVPFSESGYVNVYGQDITERVNNARALQKAHDNLEIIVQSRTEELLLANQHLQAEVVTRLQAEETLRQANAYNRGLIEASLDPLLVIGLDGKISDVNAATERITGHGRAELIGTDFFAYFTDPARAMEAYREVLRKGSVQGFELEFRHTDGTTRQVDYNATVYHDASGAVVGVFTAAHDITQRKQAQQQALIQTTALEAAANGVIITDIDGTILWSNPAAAQISGYTYGETLNQNARMFKSDQTSPDVFKDLWQTILAGKVWHGELTNRRKDGSLYIEEETITPVLNGRGAISHFIAIKQDVTERRQVDLALKAEREHLLALSQSERDQRLFAVSLAQATVALSSSLNLNEVLDQILDLIEQVIPFDAALIALFDQEIIQIARSRGFESWPAIIEELQSGIPAEIYPLLKESGVWHHPGKKTNHRKGAGFSSVAGWEWVKAFISIPLQNGENGIGSLNIFYEYPQDFENDQVDRLTAFANQASIAIQNARLFRALETSLAQEHELLTRLIQSEKMAAMGRMIASVTHELNNPLQTIKNCLFLSSEDLPAGSPVHEYLDMAISETARINDLVNQLREIYRPKSENSNKPHSLLKIVDEVHSLLKPHLDNMHVTWRQATDTQELLVHCNADQIKQVFINIGMNGIEAMQPGGGTLEVTWSQTEDPHQVGVAFRDTGPGIPKEILKNLFEPFTTTKPSGLGLGLSICYELVQRHHGQISVDTELDHGTTITVWLPL